MQGKKQKIVILNSFIVIIKEKIKGNKNMTNKEIREKIEELADAKYKEFHTGLCPNSNEIIGVRVPALRNFAKEIVKNRKSARNTKQHKTSRLLCKNGSGLDNSSSICKIP